MQQAQDFLYGFITAALVVLGMIYRHIVIVIILVVALLIIVEMISKLKKRLGF